MNAPITKKQITKIHTVRRQVAGLETREAYDSLLEARFRVSSTKDLTKAQAIRLIDYLERGSGGDLPHPSLRITNAQLAMLKDILSQCGMAGQKAATWARRVMKNSGDTRHINDLKQLTKDEARIAIPMAKAVFVNYFGKDHDPDGYTKQSRRFGQ